MGHVARGPGLRCGEHGSPTCRRARPVRHGRRREDLRGVPRRGAGGGRRSRGTARLRGARLPADLRGARRHSGHARGRHRGGRHIDGGRKHARRTRERNALPGSDLPAAPRGGTASRHRRPSRRRPRALAADGPREPEGDRRSRDAAPDRGRSPSRPATPGPLLLRPDGVLGSHLPRARLTLPSGPHGAGPGSRGSGRRAPPRPAPLRPAAAHRAVAGREADRLGSEPVRRRHRRRDGVAARAPRPAGSARPGNERR